jgi:predicted Zn-dependent peptidase
VGPGTAGTASIVARSGNPWPAVSVTHPVELHQTEIDGVPAVWAESDGPFGASLSFRVGRADETLARSGLAHLVEHLALYAFGEDPDHNGFVDGIRTVFHRTGDPEEIVDFFGELCPRLHALPLDRIETEKRILRSEAAGRNWTIHDRLADRRYGAASYGLGSYVELGLPALTGDDVSAWARRYASRGNAVLALTGPPPSGLKLELPHGSRVPAPAPTIAAPSTPAWFVENLGGVALGMVVRRTHAASLLAAILERRLRRVLRFEQGLSYSPWTRYDRRDADHAHLVVMVDALAENFASARDGLLEVMTEIASRPPTVAELDELRREAAEWASTPAAAGYSVTAAAGNILLDRPFEDDLQAVAARDAVSSEDVRLVAEEALGTAIACVPPGIEMPEPWVRLPDASVDSVSGRSHRRVAKKGTPDQRLFRLIAGDEGVSITDGKSHSTVRFQSCVAALAWPDGRRQLMGLDGVGVVVEPTVWQGGRSVVELIDTHVRPEQVVAQPARDPAQIPKGRRRVPTWVLATLCALCIMFMIVAAASREQLSEDLVGFLASLGYVGGLIFLVILGGRAFDAFKLWRNRRTAARSG